MHYYECNFFFLIDLSIILYISPTNIIDTDRHKHKRNKTGWNCCRDNQHVFSEKGLFTISQISLWNTTKIESKVATCKSILKNKLSSIPKKIGNKTICPDEDTGKNSVNPCIMPRKIKQGFSCFLLALFYCVIDENIINYFLDITSCLSLRLFATVVITITITVSPMAAAPIRYQYQTAVFPPLILAFAPSTPKSPL